MVALRARLVLLLVVRCKSPTRPRAPPPWRRLPSKEMVTRRAVSYCRPRWVAAAEAEEEGVQVWARDPAADGPGDARLPLPMLPLPPAAAGWGFLAAAPRCTEGRGAVMVRTGRGDVGVLRLGPAEGV